MQQLFQANFEDQRNTNMYVFHFILPSQKRKQYHILRLLEDRFSPPTQSILGAGTLTHILQKNNLQIVIVPDK